MQQLQSLRFLLLMCVLLFVGCGGGGGGGRSAGDEIAEESPVSFQLGAHYYHWFPSNFSHGYVRATLLPQQEPALGEYNSRDPRVAAQHIEWAASAGIDFFTLDWWPTRPQQNSAIDEGFLRAPNLSKIKFCIFYETGDLGFSATRGGTFFGPNEVSRFVSDMKSLAGRYFNHPQYLTIRGKKVVVLYITRTLAGEFESAFALARDVVREAGFELFLVGDEVFWNVSEARRDGVAITQVPQRDRIKLFDAITAYNLYEGAYLHHSGYAAESQFIAEVNGIFGRYKGAAGDVPLFPSIIPGYNDRGVRPRQNHYPIPRQYAAGESATSLFEEMYERVLVRNLDQNTPVGFITSWNEWNEDTAIEPIMPSAATARDSSSTGDFFTQGYQYQGVGEGYLAALRRLRFGR